MIKQIKELVMKQIKSWNLLNNLLQSKFYVSTLISSGV
jgi:hypothetical protein